jgi:hypothetical protein
MNQERVLSESPTIPTTTHTHSVLKDEILNWFEKNPRCSLVVGWIESVSWLGPGKSIHEREMVRYHPLALRNVHDVNQELSVMVNEGFCAYGDEVHEYEGCFLAFTFHRT